MILTGASRLGNWTPLNSNFISTRKQLTFGSATTGFPTRWHLRIEHRNSILMRRHYPDLGSASDWLNQISHADDQSEALPRSGYWHVISMKFLCSYLRCCWAGKPVVESPNVGFFLRVEFRFCKWRARICNQWWPLVIHCMSIMQLGVGKGGWNWTENNSRSSDNSAKAKVRCTCFLRRNIICSYESCPKSNIQVN